MYICVCNAITDKQILQAQKNGCRSINEITQHLGVGSGCGGCVEKAEDLLIENAGVQRFNPLHFTDLSLATA